MRQLAEILGFILVTAWLIATCAVPIWLAVNDL